MNQTRSSHAYIMFKLFSLRPNTTEYIAFIETLERLYERGIISLYQIRILNDYLAGYNVSEITARYNTDCVPELDRLLLILSSITGYSDYKYITSFIIRTKKMQAQTAMNTLSQQYDFVQEIA